jgi:hypothetical protein
VKEKTLKKFVFITQFVAMLATASVVKAQVDWRFGFEDTWNQLNLLTPAQREVLLARLTPVVAAQKVRGVINLNTPAGGWRGMQPKANAAINFTMMGHETSNATADDLKIPIQFYALVGEVEFSGAVPPRGGYGDASRNHFWNDTALAIFFLTMKTICFILLKTRNGRLVS